MNYRTDADYKAVADTVPVFCAHDEIVDVEKLLPNPKNPNQHPEDQIALLAQIIRATGWRQPITVSTASGYVVRRRGTREHERGSLGARRPPPDLRRRDLQSRCRKPSGGVRANLLLTDPPYNVSYVGKSKDALTIKNDSMDSDSFRKFLEDAFRIANDFMHPGAAFYIWYASWEVLPVETACRNNDWEVRQTLIWNKNSMVFGRQDYQWKHEPCLYGWKDGAAHTWENDRSQTTVLDFDRPTVNKEHPTMKPVALFEYLIRNNTKPGDIVLDTFAGSGTTMIAAEASGRKAYLAELDPKYTDVIVKRYVRTTGSRNVKLIRDGHEVKREEYSILLTE